MPAGAQTYGLGEALLEPQALPPPPLRRALFIVLVVLACILHVGTAGWSEIHDGVEGIYATGARDMLRLQTGGVPVINGAPAPHEPPLLQWAIAGSYQMFGVSAAAARLPIAAAMVVGVALTFLIGEVLVGYWRGFVAGLLHLLSFGGFLWGRNVTPEPLFAAFIAGAFFCAICGYQQRKKRRRYFAGAWLCIGLACLTKGAAGLLLPGVVFGLLALLLREARMRFPALLHWSGVVIFVVLIGAWFGYVQLRFPGTFAQVLVGWLSPFSGGELAGEIAARPLGAFLVAQLVALSPALLLVLPGLLFSWRNVTRLREMDLADALPLCWAAAGFLPLLVLPHRQDYHSIAMWSGFALWAAIAWERMTVPLRIAGIALLALCGIAAVFAGPLISSATGIPAVELVLSLNLKVIAAALCVFGIAAAVLASREQERWSLVVLMAAMLPAGLGAAEAVARLNPFLSSACAAQFLQPQLGEAGQVLYEGPRASASSLGFYLDRPFTVVEDEAAALEQMHTDAPVYLIIHRDRVPHWQRLLTERFSIYHQLATCGSHVVLNNHQ
jgi:4-amino-4-deoxy-L-arabinose transferase-like glycosyltransferase